MKRIIPWGMKILSKPPLKALKIQKTISDEMFGLVSYTHTWWLVNNGLRFNFFIMHRLQNAQTDGHITKTVSRFSPPPPDSCVLGEDCMRWVDGWQWGAATVQSPAATDNVVSAMSANTRSKYHTEESELSSKWRMSLQFQFKYRNVFIDCT